MHSAQSAMQVGPAHPPQKTTKTRFAEMIGVTKGRVSQLIKAGLPVEPDGKIPVAAARAWIDVHVDPNRRSADVEGAGGQSSFIGVNARDQRAQAEADIAQLKAEERRGNLIDRRAALRAVEGRARAERDAWIGWVNRTAPAIADATGCDLATCVAVLDKSVREQLQTLANLSLSELER